MSDDVCRPASGTKEAFGTGSSFLKWKPRPSSGSGAAHCRSGSVGASNQTFQGRLPAVHFSSAVAGGGKSHAAYRSIHEKVLRGEWILYVVPTIDLIKEAASALTKLLPEITPEVIHNGVTVGVGATILKALNERPEGGRVLIITWSAFQGLPFFPARQRWSLVIDEIPQATMVDELTVPDTHVHLTPHVDLIERGPVWSRLAVKKKGALRKLSGSADVALKTTLAPLARTLLSPNWTSYTRTAGFHDLVHGTGKKLIVHTVLRSRIFHGFKQVTILGANFKNSLLYMLWHQEGVVFTEDEDLKRGLRHTHHTNGHLVTICYGLEQDWSKSLRDRQDRLVWDRLVKAAGDRMEGMPFGWVANKDMENPFPSLQAECLPQLSYGLNAWQHLDRIVFLSARLPISAHFAFLEWRGISGEDVRKACYLEPVYQTIMRCSIRDPGNLNPKVVVVPDRSAAEFLRGLLPGSRVEKLKIDLDGITLGGARGRPRKHVDGTGRVQHHRAKHRAELDRISALLASDDPVTITQEDLAAWYGMVREKTCNENPIIERNGNNVTQNCMGSLFASRHATSPVAIVTEVDVDTFVKALKQAHRRVLTRKDDNRLFSPAIFDATLSSETDRGLANVAYANGLWLDCDCGHLDHKELSNLFPTIRMVAFNTFSSSRSQLRYRVYVPTSRTVTPDEYRFLTGQIVQIVKDAGYRLAKKDVLKPHLKAHGIDMSKLHAASMFYLPCQPQDPKGRIWKDYKDPLRKALDVDDWLENAIPVETADYVPELVIQSSEEHPCDQARIERAMERWNTHGVQKGQGDRELWILSQELKAANVSRHERNVVLQEAAGRAHSPSDRLRQARAIMRS